MMTLSVVADLALCAYPTARPPEPAQCATVSGPGAFTVDLEETSSGLGAAHGYLVFEIPALPGGASIVDATLRLHTTGAMYASTNEAGEIWEVEAFDEDSLTAAPPATVGAAALAPTVGAVGVDEEVAWALPPAVVSARAPLYLAVVPVSANGADYADVMGAVPPVIDLTLAL